MNTAIRPMALAALLLLAAASGAAEVKVSYVHPETYVDMPFSPSDREQVLKDLSEHFVKLGARLPPGQSLKVDVIDVNLAGHRKMNFRGGNEIRVLRGGADWPRIELRYTLESHGKVITSGADTLANMNYLARINRYQSGDPLRYEKQMIDDWFKEKIAPHAAG